MVTQPHVRVLDDALQRCIGFKGQSDALERLGNIVKIELAVLRGDGLRSGLRWADLPVHLTVDPVHPRHRVPWSTLIDGLVLVRVGDAGECKLVVDGACVVAEVFSQPSGHGDVMIRKALAGEERLELLWKRVRHRRQADRVVFAALVERRRPVSARPAILRSLFVPVRSAAAFAVLSVLIDGP